jgi:hypothetical protein
MCGLFASRCGRSHHGHDRVHPGHSGTRVLQEGVQYGCRVCHARRFDENSVELPRLCHAKDLGKERRKGRGGGGGGGGGGKEGGKGRERAQTQYGTIKKLGGERRYAYTERYTGG